MEDWVHAGVLPLQIEFVGGGTNPGENGERPNPAREELVTTRQVQVTSIQQNHLPHFKLNIPVMLIKVPFLCCLCLDQVSPCSHKDTLQVTGERFRSSFGASVTLKKRIKGHTNTLPKQKLAGKLPCTSGNGSIQSQFNLRQDVTPALLW